MKIKEFVGVSVIGLISGAAGKFVADKVCDYFFSEEEILPTPAPKRKPAKSKRKPAKSKRKPAKSKRKPAEEPKKKPAKVQEPEPAVSE